MQDDSTEIAYRRGQLLQEVYAWYERGSSVFPTLHKTPSFFGWVYEDGRRRYSSRWSMFQRRRPSEACLDAMFVESQTWNGAALITGRVSGMLCVRDFDVAESFRAWAKANMAVATRLPVVRTSRGFHVYFRQPQHAKEVFLKYDDGELVGDSRHYVLMAGSKHPTGIYYEWLHGQSPEFLGGVPVLPLEQTGLDRSYSANPRLKSRPKSPPRPPEVVSPPSREDDVVRKRFKNEHERIRWMIEKTLPPGEGYRNTMQFRLAREVKALGATTVRATEIFDEWWESACSRVSTKNYEYCVKDFLRQYSLVKVPAGGRLATRQTLAEVELPDWMGSLRGQERTLAALFWRMSGEGEKEFFLSYQLMCEVTGIKWPSSTHAYVAKWVRRGWVTIVKKGLRGPKATGQATVFRMVKPPAPWPFNDQETAELIQVGGRLLDAMQAPPVPKGAPMSDTPVVAIPSDEIVDDILAGLEMGFLQSPLPPPRLPLSEASEGLLDLPGVQAAHKTASDQLVDYVLAGLECGWLFPLDFAAHFGQSKNLVDGHQMVQGDHLQDNRLQGAPQAVFGASATTALDVVVLEHGKPFSDNVRPESEIPTEAPRQIPP